MIVYFYIGFLGLFVGSFLNVLADRLPNGEDVISKRSHCDKCKRILAWYELIPVLSFVLQKGRCRKCKTKLSWQYPLSELLTGVVFFLVSYFSITNHQLLIINLIIASCLIVIFIADLKYMIIPDEMLIVLVVAALIKIFFVTGLSYSVSCFLSAFFAFVFFLSIYLITKSKGMGFGDVKLAPVLGLVLGFPDTVIAFYTAFLTGAFIGVILLIGGKKGLKSRIAFGPFLIIGTVISILFKTQILIIWKKYTGL